MRVPASTEAAQRVAELLAARFAVARFAEARPLRAAAEESTMVPAIGEQSKATIGPTSAAAGAAADVGPIVAFDCSPIAGTIVDSSAAARKGLASANRATANRAASSSATLCAASVDAGTRIAAGGQF